MYKKLSVSFILVFFITNMFIVKPTDTSATIFNYGESIISVAKNEIGYFETTYDDGSFYSKYGDWYGYPNGAWCAMFISWCANKSNIPETVLPKFASCSKGKEWFIRRDLWKNKESYIPKMGDLIFLNNCTHVGLVEYIDENNVYTIEGNSCDENGENYGVRQKSYSLHSNKITAYGKLNDNLNEQNTSTSKREEVYYLGDVNMDGILDITDVRIIQLYLAKSIVMDDSIINLGDINNDSAINIIDSKLISKYSLGMISELP